MSNPVYDTCQYCRKYDEVYVQSMSDGSTSDTHLVHGCNNERCLYPSFNNFKERVEHENPAPPKSVIKKSVPAKQHTVDLPKYDGKPNTSNHYGGTSEDMQPIEVMQSMMSQEAFCGFLKCTALKYIFRAGKKPNNPASQDIDKAIVYLTWFKEAREGKTIDPRK